MAPLSLQGVIIASLIVLMPGLTLTTAVSELTEQATGLGNRALCRRAHRCC